MLALPGFAAIVIPNGPGRLVHALIGLGAAGAFYLLLAVISPGGIGMGDVKLSGILGLYLGWLGLRTFTAGLMGGFVLAALVALGPMAAGVSGFVLLVLVINGPACGGCGQEDAAQ